MLFPDSSLELVSQAVIPVSAFGFLLRYQTAFAYLVKSNGVWVFANAMHNSVDGLSFECTNFICIDGSPVAMKKSGLIDAGHFCESLPCGRIRLTHEESTVLSSEQLEQRTVVYECVDCRSSQAAVAVSNLTHLKQVECCVKCCAGFLLMGTGLSLRPDVSVLGLSVCSVCSVREDVFSVVLDSVCAQWSRQFLT